MLKPALRECLSRGVRIISQHWGIKGFEPSSCVSEYVDGYNVLLNMYEGIGCVREVGDESCLAASAKAADTCFWVTADFAAAFALAFAWFFCTSP